MIPTVAWRAELVRVGLVLTLLLLLGLFIGATALLLFVGLTLYLGWHLFQIYRLSRWLDSPKRHPRPHAVGIWRHILDTIDELRERGRKRKRKIGRMLSGFLESTSALPDATVVLDDGGAIEWWNQAAEMSLGLSRKQGKGMPIEALIRDRVFLSYLERGDYSRPIQIPAPVNDAISLEIRIVPYGKGKRLLQARDITRLQQLETVRRDFVANVSHEMRTPLTVLHGYLESMCDSEQPELGPWQNILHQMQQQTCRMQGIVGDLLLLSRLESDRDVHEGQGEVDVPFMLKGLLGQAEELSGGHNHRFKLQAEQGFCIHGNASELESAFSNLLFNAVRYTPDGGEINVTWGKVDGAPCFSVADSGIGIESGHIPRLTERFYRVDVARSRESGGTGLGLAIVKHVMTRHRGSLKIQSELGKGSVFTCRFPKDIARKAV
jgi:two-component system phosphate regulon sensor histidine kinase PhoR